MLIFLRQSTASQVRSIGPFIDDTDFKSLENGLTIANTDIKLKKNGATSVNKNSGGATADGEGGTYALTFDASDSNTVGEIFGSVKVSGALVVIFRCVVFEEAVYDAFYAGGAPGFLRSTVDGRTLDVSAGGAAGADWANVEGQSTSVNLSGTTTNLVNTTTTNTDMITAPTNFADMAITATTGLVSVGTNNDKTEYAISGTKNTLDDLNDVSIANVTTGADTALVNNGLNHLLAAAVVGADVADDSIFARLVSDQTTADWDDYVHTTSSLTSIKTTASATNSLAGAINTNIGTAGAGLTDVGGMSTAMKAEVNAEVDGAIETYGLDHLVQAAVVGADVTDDSIIAQLVSKSATADWDSYANTSNSLEAIRDKQTDIETDTADLQVQVGTAGDGLTDLGGMSTGMKTEVNAEVVNVITVDAISELAQGVPPTTPSLATAVMLLYMGLRNRLDVDTSGTDFLGIYNNANQLITKKLVTDDSATYSEAKMITGA